MTIVQEFLAQHALKTEGYRGSRTDHTNTDHAKRRQILNEKELNFVIKDGLTVKLVKVKTVLFFKGLS